MRKSMTWVVFVAALAFWSGSPTAASAKVKKVKSCASTEAAFLATGEGDRDGDGLSDCRESKQLRTSATLADTDGDGLSDGEELAERCDPLDPDSDRDGVEDRDDSSPGIPEQEIKAFVDALTCPLVGVPGSITALGVTAIVDALTEFEDETCDALVARLTTLQPVFVEIEILEDANGVLTAAEVEVEHDDDHGDEHD